MRRREKKGKEGLLNVESKRGDGAGSKQTNGRGKEKETGASSWSH